ncbi:MAG: hypothetical protein P8X79_19160 [Reinekea sp.]
MLPKNRGEPAIFEDKYKSSSYTLHPLGGHRFRLNSENPTC